MNGTAPLTTIRTRSFVITVTPYYIKILVKSVPVVFCIQAAIELEPFIEVRFVCHDGIVVDMKRSMFEDDLCLKFLKRIRYLNTTGREQAERWKQKDWKKHGLQLTKYPSLRGRVIALGLTSLSETRGEPSIFTSQEGAAITSKK